MEFVREMLRKHREYIKLQNQLVSNPSFIKALIVILVVGFLSIRLLNYIG